HPASDGPAERFFPAGIAPAIAAGGKLLQAGFHLRHAFGVYPQPSFAFYPVKGVAKEFNILDRDSLALLPVDFQEQSVLNKPGNRFHHPFSTAFALTQNNHVVRIPYEPVAPTFQLLVQLIQHDVAEQRTQRTTLWYTHFAGFNSVASLHTGIQVAVDQ